jgi:hypothetical protein
MAQEFVWPMALAYTLPLDGNPYHQRPAIREWIEAGILYAARSAHPDGSCDDYFPFEKAAGAAAFTLLACFESYSLLGLHNQEMLDFFAKRASWLADHHESGRLTNHQALIVLCLEKVGRLLATDRWDALRAKRLSRVLEWQNSEGWFQEYEGCDPGYHTLTIALLAQVYELTPSRNCARHWRRRFAFAAHFVHPTARSVANTRAAIPITSSHTGFEIAGKWLPESLEINDRFLVGLGRGLGPAMQTITSSGITRGAICSPTSISWPSGQPCGAPMGAAFKNAGIVIERRGSKELYLALNKGGVFKYFARQAGALGHPLLRAGDGREAAQCRRASGW